MKKSSKRKYITATLSAALIASAFTPVVSAKSVKTFSKVSVKKVTVVNSKTVMVEFNGPLNKATALKTSNYVFGKGSGLSVTKVTLSGNKALLTVKGVEVKTTSFKVGLTVLNIKDNKGVTMTAFKTNVGFTIVPPKPTVFTKAQTFDSDKNGKLDKIILSFSQAVSGVDAADFKVEGYNVVNATGAGSNATLTLAEGAASDLTAKPTVSFVGEVKANGKSVTSISPIKSSLGFALFKFSDTVSFAFNPVQEFTGIGKIPSDFTRPVGSKLQFRATITKDGLPIKGLKFNWGPSYIFSFETNEQGVAYIALGDEISESSLVLLKSADGAPVDFKVAAPAGEYSIKIDLVDRAANDSAVAGTSFTYALK